MDIARIARIDGAMPLIRTDFTSDDAWSAVIETLTVESDVSGEGDMYEPNIKPVSDPAFDGLTAQALAGSWPREHHGYAILADARTMRESGSPEDTTVVLVDLSAEDEDEAEFGWIFGQTFRCVVSEVASIEANLSISNMDFAEFAGSVDEGGVFRGF